MSDIRYPSPADKFVVVTPSDSTDIVPTRALYVGGAGDVVIKADGAASSVTLSSVAAGSVIPVSVRYVMATGTTATDIVALY